MVSVGQIDGVRPTIRIRGDAWEFDDLAMRSDGLQMIGLNSHPVTIIRAWDVPSQKVALNLSLLDEMFPKAADLFEAFGGSQLRFATYSEDGRTLVTDGGLSGGAVIWDLTARRIIQTLGKGHISGAGFVPGGQMVMADHEGVCLWDYHENRMISRLTDHFVGPTASVSLSTGGRFILIVGGKAAIRLDAQTKTLVGAPVIPDVYEFEVVKADYEATHTLAHASGTFSPDGSKVAFVECHDVECFPSGGIDIYDTAEPRRLSQGVGGRVEGRASFSPNGRFLAFIKWQGIRPSTLTIYDLIAEKEVFDITDNEAPIGGFAYWTVDGRRIFTGSSDRAVTTAWDVSSFGDACLQAAIGC